MCVVSALCAGALSGTVIPAPVMAIGAQASVRFTTDDSIAGDGWSPQYDSMLSILLLLLLLLLLLPGAVVAAVVVLLLLLLLLLLL